MAPISSHITFVMNYDNSGTKVLPLQNFSGTIDWGDGNIEIFSSTNQPSHNFLSAGTYTILLKDVTNLESIYYGYSPDYTAGLVQFSYNSKISTLTNLDNAFQSCINLTTAYFAENVTDNVTSMNLMFNEANLLNSPINLNCSSCTSLRSLFESATSFNSLINLTNTNNVTDMSRMFFNAQVFNQSVTLDCSSCTTFDSMFSNCSAFNSSVNLTNTNLVTTMANMFYYAGVFNQPVTLDCSSCTSLYSLFESALLFNSPITLTNTNNVTDMSRMFFNAPAFNQPVTLDCSSCTSLNAMFCYCFNFNSPVNLTNTNNVTNMALMFYSASSFNQQLSFNCSSCTTMSQMLQVTSFNNTLNLDPIPNLTTAFQMLSGNPLSPQNYSNLLNLWADNSPNLQSNVNLGAHFIKYNSSGAASRNMLINDYSWNIIDGGLYVPPAPTITNITPNIFPTTGGSATIIGTDFNNNLVVTLEYYGTYQSTIEVSTFTDQEINCIIPQIPVEDYIGYSVKVTTDSGSATVSISYHRDVTISDTIVTNNTLFVNGNGFDNYITDVKINTLSVMYVIVDENRMNIYVDPNTHIPDTYTVYIFSPFGNPSTTFVYNYPPNIISLTPNPTSSNSTIVIVGENFVNNNLSVYIGDEDYILNFILDSESQITATIPENILTGNYELFVSNNFGYSGTAIQISNGITNETTLTNFLNSTDTVGLIINNIEITENMINTSEIIKTLIVDDDVYKITKI